MRKLIVLVAALLLVSMVAVADHEPVVSEGDVILSGKVEMRWLQDLANKDFYEANVVEMKLDATVMDNNSLYIELEEGADGIGETIGIETTDDNAVSGGDTGTGSITLPLLDRAHFTSDVGAVFGLPIGLTVQTGFEEQKLFDEVKVTEGEWEDVIGSDWKAWGHRIEAVVAEMATIRVIFPNDPRLEGFGAGVSTNVGPAYVEVGYTSAKPFEEDATIDVDGATGPIAPEAPIPVENKEAIKLGDIEVGAEFAQEVAAGIEVAAAATLDFDLGAVDAEKSYDVQSGSGTVADPYVLGAPADYAYETETQWEAGVGVAVTYESTYTLGVAWKGMQDAEAGSMQLGLQAALDPAEVNIFAGLGLDSDTYDETFDSLEGSVAVMVGAAKFTVGALWKAEGSAGIAKEKAETNPDGDDGTSIFMRGELEY